MGLATLMSPKGFAFGKLLEDIHVTWTRLGKKRVKIAALHEVAWEICAQCPEMASEVLATSELTRDDVRPFVMASERSRLKQNSRRFGEAMTS
ncbi:hypothetical protein Tco_1476036 [Tanacetum coccineum]